MEETKNINNESTENKKEELYRYQVAEIVISDNEEIGCKYYEYDEVYYTGEGMEDTTSTLVSSKTANVEELK